MKFITKKYFLISLVLTIAQGVYAQAPSISYPSTNVIASGTAFTVSPTNTGGAVPATTYGQVSTFAGSLSQSSGYTNATGTNALFNLPKRMVMDASGNIYLTDKTNNAIRKITPAGVVTTFAGSLTGASGFTNATGTAALFNGPVGIAIDGSGNLFVGDYNNNVIRKITPAAVVTTFYSLSGMGPAGMCFDGSGNLIATAQSLSKILKITPAGVATTVAGNYYGYANGTGTAALFENPIDVQIDASGNMIVADYQNNAIRKITPAGVVTTIAGSTTSGNTGSFLDGVGTAARFNNPTGVAITQGGIIYIADFVNQDIRRMMPDGTVTLIAGSPTHATGNTDAIGTAATFNNPISIYVDNTGTGYVVDMWAAVRKIVLTGYTLSGTLPAGLTFSPTTGVISGTPTGTLTSQTATVTAYNASGYSTATVTFTPLSQTAPNITYASDINNLTVGIPVTLNPTNTGGPVPATIYGQVTTLAGNATESAGYLNDNGTAARFNWPQSMVKDASGNLYVTDANNNAIRMITPSGTVTTFAGSLTGAAGNTNATGTSALFTYPDGIAIDGSGNLFVADYGNNAIRKITPGAAVTTFYSSTDSFGPGGICFDSAGNLIVTAQDASRIIKISPSGVATTIAGDTPGYANGTGTAALFNEPSDVKADASGNLYVTDFLNNAIRKITPAGVVTTYAGSDVNGNMAGYADGVGTAAIFNNPTGLAVGAGGVIYVADIYNNDIRKIMPDGRVTLVAGNAVQLPGDGDGTGTTAWFSLPANMYIDGSGMGYISELGANRIKKIILTGYSLTGTLPAGLTFDSTTGIISGTPTAQTTLTQFSVTAYNAFGFSTTNLSINAAPVLPSNPANDYDRNWVHVRTYDENGVEVGASKSFFDNNGKPTQAQVKNETTGNVLATQTIYDLQGRAVIGTLPAPINNSAFAYKTDFVTSGNAPYSYLNFDGDPASTATANAKLNNPDAVDHTTPGTLGWYYSDSNTAEPYVAATGYPYSRGDFYHDGTGAAKRSAGIGEQLKMGMGREVTSNSFPVQNELSNYLAIRNQFFPAAVAGNNPSSMAGQALQSVSTDQNGTSAVSVTDLSGKMTMMTGRADPGTVPWLSVNNTLSLSNVDPQYTITVNISGNLINSLVINTTNTVTVYASIPGNPGCIHCQVYTGPGKNYSFAGSGYNSCQIFSDNPFTVTASNAAGVVYDHAEATYTEPSGSSIQYFQLATPSLVTLTGNYTLFNMSTETDITSTFNNGSSLTPGYYKVTANSTTDPLTTNNVTVSYTNKYSDISYNYYNQLGQLIASIAPKGVQQLVPPNSLATYTTASQLPFVSLYNYDLQGRLTSASTPDGGTSNYIYRTDGKIRFSQNAVQRNTDATGAQKDPSFVEKISYTNYDNIGRPVESGEYVIPNGTAAVFAGLSTNTTLLDGTNATTSNLSVGTKQSQVNTNYDLPDPSPAYSASVTGYTQDAGFLKGAVSYTSNANSTTWYNYDDHGRVTWTVKSISGLGYKTVNYTYNDQGNVTKVDYQKGTSSERFIHYYAYDADGRLTNVQTSRDDINKVQQANYYYYLHGPLKRTELGDHLQGIDYVYTAQGWLKSMNTPTQNTANDPGQDGVSNTFANDAFGMQVEYFPGDYSRTGRNITSVTTGQPTYYNGNVNGISWQSNKPSSALTNNPTIQQPNMYTYSYDSKYQLTGATWGTPSFTGAAFTANNTFNENNIKYDPNGNIMSLKRTGTNPDDFSDGYTYANGTNQLTKVHDGTKNSDYANYTYDEIGRLKSELQPATATSPAISYYLQYDVTGKITGIYSDPSLSAQNLKESYTYDESGNRIKTVNVVNNITTYYVYDANGNVMAIYTGTTTTTPAISEMPFYGSGSRLGTYFCSSGNYQYELRDNVGSVRVVINGTKTATGQADIVTYNDYYPYGSIAQSGSPGYRYDYQGAYSEKDSYTNWNNFQLRMYDGKIGRWLTVDPVGQYASPYEGMGNNPVGTVDPSGGEGEDGGCCDVIGDLVNWVKSLVSKPGSPDNPIELQGITVTDKATKGSNVGPYQVGWEWLSGSGPRKRYFTGADYFTQVLMKHSHITDVKNYVANRLKSNGGRPFIEQSDKHTNYNLGGLKGVPLYINDYSTLLTAGKTGNIAVTYLGSYGLKIAVTKVDVMNRTATVHFTVTNNSTIQSATHPPVIGYTDWWKNNVGDPLDNTFSTGPLSKTSQTFNWNDIISW